MKKVLLLGCTGSIGRQTLDIVRNMKDDFRIVGLTCKSSKKELEKLCQEFDCGGSLFEEEGQEGLERLIKDSKADIAVNGVAGSAGLLPSLLVIQNGIDLALANKETVVMAWPLIKKEAEKFNVNIIPVDSEHSAIFNLTQKIGSQNIDEILITASGGPFRNMTKNQLENVTLEEALKHPTWNMGKKITVDSASLANKGLEVIEAQRLFDFPTEKIKVLVHPESLVHSLVRTKDGMLYAQISNPDMRHPILGALTWPENTHNYLEKFDLFNHTLTFYPPRLDDFPMLKYAYECAQKGNSYTIAFNAANEIAADRFIKKEGTFNQIAQCTHFVLQNDFSCQADSFQAVFENDKRARLLAESFYKKM